MTLALVRHGRTAWNLARRMQGRTDIPLDPFGRAQASAAGELLTRARWHRISSSPLNRALETARLIAAQVPNAPVDVVADLIERDYGAAEGLPVSEVHERWPDGSYPGGESLAEVTGRARRVLQRIDEQSGHSIVVAHGSLLRIGVEALTGSACPRILNGQVVMLDRPDGRAFQARFLSA